MTADSTRFIPHPDSIYLNVDVKAQHPDGELGYRKLFEKNLKISTPVDNGAPEGKYIVWASCIIDSAGKITSIVAETKHGYGMEAELVRVLKKLPDFKPALKNGQPVNSRLRFPYVFVISVE